MKTSTDVLQEEPTLTPVTKLRLNKKALIFLGATVTGSVLLAAWGVSQISIFGTQPVRPPRSDVVQLPEDSLPLPIPPAKVMASAPVVASSAPFPIPVVPAVPPQRLATTPPLALPQQDARWSSSMGLQSMPTEPSAAATAVRRVGSMNTLLAQGTMLRCVLETRIVTGLAGAVACVITEPVYAVNGYQVLIPAGSRVLGQYKLQELESGRVGAIWERILTPDGVAVDLHSLGTDGMGSAGHPGHVDKHWGSRLQAAILISLIGDLVQVQSNRLATQSARNTTTLSANGAVVAQQTNPYQSQTADTLQQQARSALQESAQRAATVTVNQGSLISIYTAKDVDFAPVLGQ